MTATAISGESPVETVKHSGSEATPRERTHRTGDGVDETTVEEAMVELKLWDKIAALRMLGRHFGMFKDRLEHSGEVSLLDALRRIERREDEAKAAAPQRRPA